MQLKREVPKRSVRQIIKVLELEGFAEPGVLKPSTMQRHLYDAGFGRKQMKRYAEKRAVSSRRFCQPHRMEIGAFTSKVPPVPLGMTGSIPVERWLYAGLLGQLGLEPHYFSWESKRLLQKENRAVSTEQKLKLQAYEAIRQRMDMNIVLWRLDRAEAGKYIAAHMAYAGAEKEIFTSGAEDEVYKISAGIPRMINRVCEKTLMYACWQQKQLLDEHMVRFVADHAMLGGAG